MSVRRILSDAECRGWLASDFGEHWETAIVIYDVDGKQSRWTYLFERGKPAPELTDDLFHNLGRLVAVVRAKDNLEKRTQRLHLL